MKSEHGAILVDGMQVASTHYCPHCSAHFTMVKGSGAMRGWCLSCHAVTCGREECDVCIPVEEKLNYLSGLRVGEKYRERIIELVG